jgi:hypothetical protein
MKAETLARLGKIARGEIVPESGVTGVTSVTSKSVTPQKPASLHPLHLLHLENDKKKTTRSDGVTTGVTGEPSDAFELAERAAIAIVDGRVPTAYADAWAAFQIRKPCDPSAADWIRAVDDIGRFLDEWAWLALDFDWQPPDIFGPSGLGWFSAGERIRALGPYHAVTTTGRVFTRATPTFDEEQLIGNFVKRPRP